MHELIHYQAAYSSYYMWIAKQNCFENLSWVTEGFRLEEERNIFVFYFLSEVNLQIGSLAMKILSPCNGGNFPTE